MRPTFVLRPELRGSCRPTQLRRRSREPCDKDVPKWRACPVNSNPDALRGAGWIEHGDGESLAVRKRKRFQPEDFHIRLHGLFSPDAILNMKTGLRNKSGGQSRMFPRVGLFKPTLSNPLLGEAGRCRTVEQRRTRVELWWQCLL